MSDFETHPFGTMEKIANQQIENWAQADRIVALEAENNRMREAIKDEIDKWPVENTDHPLYKALEDK